MKPTISLAVFAIVAANAFSASALSITNLDITPQTMVLAEVQGSKVTRTIAPNETVHITSARGQAFLQQRPEQLLNVEHLDRLVIWPEGNLTIQMRRKGYGRSD